MDPTLLVFFARSIETLINAALKYDPATRQKLSQLTSVLAIHSQSPDISVYCQSTANGIRLLSHYEDKADVEITGSPSALLSLLKKPTTFANSDLHVSGNVGLLQQWQQALQDIDIDWEDAISGVLGDIAGPMLAQKLRQGAAWAKDFHQEQWRLLKEYLPEELQVVPSKAELDHFYQAVSELSMDTDRISARLNRIADLISQGRATPNNSDNPQ